MSDYDETAGAASSLPVMLRVAGREVVVVGAGPVGRRKAAAALACGARVRLVDPAAEDAPLAAEMVREPFRAEHLDGAAIVFACTDAPAVNAAVAEAARQRGLPVSRADAPAQSDFTLPAVHREAGVTIAVATDAGTPALAAMIRDLLATALPADLPAFAAATGALRERLLRDEPDAGRRAAILRRACGTEGLAAFRAGGPAGLETFARKA